MSTEIPAFEPGPLRTAETAARINVFLDAVALAQHVSKVLGGSPVGLIGVLQIADFLADEPYTDVPVDDEDPMHTQAE